MADVGEAGGLIQFLQSLGGAVGLSVLASFQATQFAALDPRPAPLARRRTRRSPLCGSYLGSLESSLIKSYDQTFFVMLGLLVVAFLFALFLKGRLPRGVPRDAPAQGAGSTVKVASVETRPAPAELAERSLHRPVSN